MHGHWIREIYTAMKKKKLVKYGNSRSIGANYDVSPPAADPWLTRLSGWRGLRNVLNSDLSRGAEFQGMGAGEGGGGRLTEPGRDGPARVLVQHGELEEQPDDDGGRQKAGQGGADHLVRALRRQSVTG